VLETEAWGTLPLATPLVGRHQALNVGLAVTALGALPEDLRPSAEAVRRGVAEVRWPGRDQIELADGVTWLFDVAHNTAGVLSLIDVVDRLDFPRPLVALVGVLGDKDWRSMLPPLFRRVDGAVLTQPASAPEARRWNLADARRAIESMNQPSTCAMVSEPDFGRALAEARRLAQGGTIVVTGSVHTVGSALRVLGKEPF
jgi:dihydrofolate synthase / folylpolyglutamate synthase